MNKHLTPFLFGLMVFTLAYTLFTLPGSSNSASTDGILSAEALDQESEKEKPIEGSKEDEKQKKLEEQFKKDLANVQFVGRWCMMKDGKLGEEREEKYTITSALKANADNWLIFARVQFGKKDVTLPVPVKVKWAGDTPVITVTDVNLPGLGTYSARVLVYKNTYAGSWFGKNYGGLMSGMIVKNKKE